VWDAARAANRARWDESAPLHAASALYDLEGVRAGADHLRPYEPRELGPVAGLDLVHLQCHIGTLGVSTGAAEMESDLR